MTLKSALAVIIDVISSNTSWFSADLSPEIPRHRFEYYDAILKMLVVGQAVTQSNKASSKAFC